MTSFKILRGVVQMGAFGLKALGFTWVSSKGSAKQSISDVTRFIGFKLNIHFYGVTARLMQGHRSRY